MLDGTPRPTAAARDEPRPGGPLPGFPPPPAPADMSAAEAEVWRDTLAACPAGLLHALDLGIFAVYVRARVLHDDAARHVREKGSVVLTREGNVIQNPYLAVMNRQAMLILRTAQEMGFTPASRTRISMGAASAGGGARDTANPFARNGLRAPRAA